MKQIKAIQTRYKGYNFRSRLEARWAVFFDALGIKYKYEEYGFENEHYKWLPDFYLPDTCTWVEVKGGTPSASDCAKMAWLLDYESPMPFVTNSGGREDSFGYDRLEKEDVVLKMEMGGSDPSRLSTVGLLLLGDIPNVDHGIALHPLIKHRKGLGRTYARFYEGKVKPVRDDAVSMFRSFYGKDIPTREQICGVGDGGSDLSVKFFTPDTYYCESILSNIAVCDAYKKARSARFEHGETPL